MPQASETEHAWAISEFGGIDDLPIVKWLREQGFDLTDSWVWIKPNREMTPKEQRAIYFLMEEWDYGGVEG